MLKEKQDDSTSAIGNEPPRHTRSGLAEQRPVPLVPTPLTNNHKPGRTMQSVQAIAFVLKKGGKPMGNSVGGTCRKPKGKPSGCWVEITTQRVSSKR